MPSDVEPRRPSRLRRILILAAGCTLLAGLLVHIPGLRTALVNAILARANPWPGTQLSVERTSGTPFGRLGATGLRLERADGVPALQVDSLRVRFALLEMLTRTVRLGDVRLSGVELHGLRQSDGLVDLLAPFVQDTASTGWTTRIDRLSIDARSVVVADSAGVVFGAEALTLALAEVETGNGRAGRLDELDARITTPGSQGRLNARGAWGERFVRLDTLAFETTRSTVHGSGTFGLDPSLGRPDSTRGRLELAPLAAADLTAFLPGLDPSATVQGHLRFGAANGTWTADGAMRVTPAGELTLRAEWTPPASGTFGHVTARLDVRDLAPSIFTGAGNDRWSGTVAADLTADSLSHLSGVVTTDVLPSVTGGRAVSGRMRQTWSVGQVTVDANGTLEGSRWSLRGRAAPFEVPPSWSADVGVVLAEDLMVAGNPIAGDLSATASGTGYDADGTAHFRLVMTQGRLGRCPMGPGALSGTFDAGRLRASIDLPACGGTVRGRGSFGTDGSWRLDELSASHVAASQAFSDSAASRLDLHATGFGSGADGRIDGRFDSLRWGAVRVDRAEARLTLRGAVQHLAATLRVDSGSVHVDARIDDRGLHVDRGRVEHLDLGALAGLPTVHTAVNAAITGTLDRNGSGQATFDLEPSRWNEQDVRSGTVRMDLARSGAARALDAAARIEWADGSIEGGGRMVSADSSILFTGLHARFDGLDAGAWAGLDRLDTRLAGKAGGGFDMLPGGVHGSVEVTLTGRVNEVRLDSARVVAAVDADSLHAAVEAVLARGRGRAAGTLSAALGAPTAFVLDLDVDSLDVARLAGIDTLASRVSMHVRATGVGLEPETARWHLDLTDVRGRWRTVRIDRSSFRGRLEAGAVDIDSLDFVGSFGQLAGRGFIPLYANPSGRTADFSFGGRIRDLGPLAELLGYPDVHTSTGRFDGTVSGPYRRLAVNSSWSMTGLAWGEVHVASLRGIVSGEVGSSLPAPLLAARLSASVLSLPGTAAESADLELLSDADSLTIDARIRFTERRTARLTGSATADLHAIGIDRLELDLDGERWTLANPVAIHRRDEGVSIDPLVLDAGPGRFTLGGQAGKAGTDFYLSAQSVRLDALADLAGYRGLSLSLDAAITASDRSGALVVGGTLGMRLGTNGRHAADLLLRTAYRNGVVQLDGRLSHVGGAEATIRGAVTPPIASRPADRLPIDLRVETAAFPVDWTLPFFDRTLISEIGGSIAGSVAIRGDFNDPELSGSAVLSQGRVGLPTLGKRGSPLVMRDLAADLRFEGSTIRVATASMRSGPGAMTVSGSVDLENLDLGTVDLALRSDEFLAIDDAVYRAYVASDLRLTGTTRRPVLSGRVNVSRGDFRLADENSADAFEPVALDREDLLTLERRFGIRVSEADTSTFVFYEALTIDDLRLDFERDAWMRSASNPRMDVQFTGSLDVRKRPHADPTVFGEIAVVPANSRIEQFGRRFNIERGTLTFTGPAFEPDVDLAGAYRVPSRGTGGDEVTIRLVATGRPDDLRVSFDSDPPMELADILSYIATGRPASGSLQFGSGTGDAYLSAAAGLAVGPLSSLMENIALAGLGLDVVEIEHDGIRGLTLTAGKYVSPEFYVSVSQPIALGASREPSADASSNDLQVTMEYEIVRKLLLSLINRGTVLKVNLRWEYAF